MKYASFRIAESDTELIPRALEHLAVLHSIFGAPELIETREGYSTYRVAVA